MSCILDRGCWRQSSAVALAVFEKSTYLGFTTLVYLYKPKGSKPNNTGPTSQARCRTCSVRYGVEKDIYVMQVKMAILAAPARPGTVEHDGPPGRAAPVHRA